MNENQDIEILANKNQVKLFNDKQEDNNNTTSDVNVNVSVSNSNENNEKLNQDYNQIKEVKLNNEESSNLNSNNKQEDTSTNNNKNTNVTSNNSKKDPKLMTLQEQVEFYKDQFTKTKKLFIHYEKENKINEQKVAKLTERIKQYEPQTGETIKILYKFSHSNSTFYYLESQKSSYFIREDLIKEIFPNAFTDNDIPEYSYEKEIKQQEETIQQIILQYDERIIRLKNEVENYEKSFLAFKDSKNASSKVIDNLKLFYDEGMKTLIRNANEVFLLLKSSSEIDYSDDQMQVDLFSNMSKHIEEFKQSDIIGSTKSVISNDSSMSISNNISNLNEVFNAKWLNELKLFTANLLKSYHDSLNSLTKTNNELIDQKTKWQNTLDQLIANNEVELNSSKLNFVLILKY